ncbi:M23 family metallopeptidase [Deinococcus sp. Marseille-Q6407]|uniref:M23 family metallopeptidase n=1 Tax=Deinococcus sp. Marseille-Q6407 TaxID=2969223 RepID=UPI0021BEE98C|nr:M23 family metallopeptidase [Deinococcus sp. Marseille-Q6407]
MRRTLNVLLPLLLVLAVLGGAAAFFWPQLQRSRQYLELARMPAPAAGTLPNPLPGAVLTDTWGGARSGGRKHEGIDIFASRGTPVHSTGPGVVLNVGENTLGGRTVMVLGPGGQRHYYAHLERYPDLKAGDWVEQGDTVGYVGNSGNAKNTPPHLHYGVYTPGGAINPYPLLKKP